MPIPFAALIGIVSLAGIVLSGAASAAEPSGCGAFKWPIERERAVLTAPNPGRLASGAELAAPPPTAIVLSLRPTGEADLPTPPERASTPDRFAGFLRFKQLAKPGAYTIALSAVGWVDVIQEGRVSKPHAFSGATDCDGLRKLVRYELSAGDLVLQISGVGADTITLAILPAD